MATKKQELLPEEEVLQEAAPQTDVNPELEEMSQPEGLLPAELPPQGAILVFFVAIVSTSCKIKIQPAVLPNCKDFFCVPAFSPALSLGQVH